jgi:murein DD-endopeptidase MepM/ murein hydrolase activator NlpD
MSSIHKLKSGLILNLALALLFSWPGGFLQEPQPTQPEQPVYIVQPGDTLWSIALRFGLTLQDLQDANGITNPDEIPAGTNLVIPGLSGVQGVLTTVSIPYGESLRSLSLRYGLPAETLVRLNRLSSPAQLYAGASLIITQSDRPPSAIQRAMLGSGESLLELAAAQGANPWRVVMANALGGAWAALPGEVLGVPSDEPGDQPSAPGALPQAISSAVLQPLPVVQGKAAVLHISGPAGLQINGTFLDHQLHFFAQQDGGYVALQGVHALIKPGLYPLSIHGQLPGSPAGAGDAFDYSQQVLVQDGGYPYDPPLSVSPELIDPAVTGPEDREWAALAAQVSPMKLWDGIFQSPLAPPLDTCWPSLFGSRRSFNGSDYVYFHSGLDFCGQVGTEIHAPAAGVVVFTGPLEIRGNTTLIDHGWGVYTAYMHQSEFRVQVGDTVSTGQVIGLVGSTGRVTGPHLHWEVIVGDVQVDPLDWLQQVFP